MIALDLKKTGDDLTDANRPNLCEKIAGPGHVIFLMSSSSKNTSYMPSMANVAL